MLSLYYSRKLEIDLESGHSLRASLREMMVHMTSSLRKSTFGDSLAKHFFHNFAHICVSVQNTKFGTPTISISRHTAHFTPAGQMYKIYRMCTDYVSRTQLKPYYRGIFENFFCCKLFTSMWKTPGQNLKPFQA